MTYQSLWSFLIKHRLSVSVFLSFIVACAVWTSLQGWVHAFTAPLHHQLDNTLRETAITFATVRALNAFISLLQESAFGFSLGFNVSIAAGQVLDPLNDLIERFSQLNLICLVALAIQKTLVDLGIFIALSFLVPLSAVVGLIALWCHHRATLILKHLFFRLGIITLFTMFALPISIVSTKAIDALLLTQQISAANQRIQAISSDLHATAPIDQTLSLIQDEAPDSLWEHFKRNGQKAQDTLEQPAKIFVLLKQIQSLDMETFIQDIIVLCGLYLLRALLMPILILWLTYRIGIYLLTLTLDTKQNANFI